MDMDLDDLLDGPSQGAARSSRFVPKGAKSQPYPRPRTEPSSSSASVSLPTPKKEEVDDKAKMMPEHDNSIVDMDVEQNPDVEKVEVPNDSMKTEAGEGEVGPADEVVREIDVYFAPSVDPKTQLYLLQYPLRPKWRPYELDDRCEEVRVKPATAEVEVDLSIDVGKNYDTGADPGIQRTKLTLAPSWKPPQTNGCTVGVLAGNKLHLNPIHAVVQLRPSFHHHDQKESKKKTAVRNNVEDLVKLEEYQEVKTPGMSKKQKAPEQTTDIGEVWIPLEYHTASSDMAAGYLQKMIAREGSQINFSMSSHDYLNSLCPGTSGDSSSSKVPSRRALLDLPLKVRFRKWLVELLEQGSRLHRFDSLKYLAPDESIEEVLAVLQELALLVQGLWIPRTSLVYEEDLGVRVLARKYVLVLFSKNVVIKYDQIPKNPRLAQAMKDVLHELGRERPILKDWKLKELPDLNFIKLYPAVVKKQQDELERMEKGIMEHFSKNRVRPIMKTSKPNTPVNLAASKGSDKLAARTSSGSMPRKVMSEEACEAIRKALQKLFKSTKTCSFQQISQRLRDMTVSEHARSSGFAKEALAAANSIDAFPDEFQTILSKVAVNIHGICVPKSSPDHPEYDDLRQVVIDLLLAEGPQAKLKKAHIYEAANIKLGKEPTQIAYQKVMQELCVSQQGSWALKSADLN